MPTLGVYGSGLDTNAIVSALVDAEITPQEARLDRQERTQTTTLSSLGSLKTSLASIEDALESLGNGSAFDALNIQAPSAVSVVKSGAATAGRYEIDIQTLANSQSLYSQTFENADSIVGSGTLTISLGQPSYVSGSAGDYGGFSSSSISDIVIDSSNNSVSGIRDAINDADVGVQASILRDGDQVRLVITSENSGIKNAMSISVSDSDGDDVNSEGLSAFSYHYDLSSQSHIGNLSESQSANDAKFFVNGIELSSATNDISGLVDGLDFTLNETTSSAVTVSVSRDEAAIVADIEKFIEAYNSFEASLNQSMSYDASSGSGVFQGDSMARQLDSMMRSAMTDQLQISGAIDQLSLIGITADRYGKLIIDSTQLTAAISSNPADVKTFFAGDTLNDGLAARVSSVIETFNNESTGLISTREQGIDAVLDRIEDQRLTVQRRRVSLEERYINQFAAMDALVGQLQSTSDFLTNQLRNIPGQNSD